MVDIVDAVDIVDKRPSPPSSAGPFVPEIALIQRNTHSISSCPGYLFARSNSANTTTTRRPLR